MKMFWVKIIHYTSQTKRFLDVINKIPEGKKFDWELPPHDEDFKNNLAGDLIHCLENSKKNIPKCTVE